MRIKCKPNLLILLAAFAMVSCGGNNASTNETVKPNIIYILVDDMGYGDLSCYGQKTLTTPNIDKMASEGISFLNHYTGSSVCGPSRASLMTGKHTGHNTVRGNAPTQLLGDDEVTIAKVLKSAGYSTGLVGKWGVGHPPPLDDPAKKGFDYAYGYINMWHAHNCYPEFLYRNGERVELKNKLQLVDGKNPWAHKPEGTGVAAVKEEYVHNLFDKEALSFIDRNKQKPFFLYLAYNVPHANNEAIPDGMEVPSYGEYADKDWPTQEKGFASMMRNIDNSVGVIFEHLKSLGLDENTIVMFCSDNGPHQEGGHLVDFFDSNGVLRGKKRDFYDGGVKTPFIVRWPGKIAANTKTNQLSAFWDVLPTFAEIANVEPPTDIDGISFLPTLLGQNEKQKQHDYLYWEFYEQGGKQAILKDDWKYIVRNVRDVNIPNEKLLFNLKDDISEQNNVMDAHPDVVKSLEQLMLGARDSFAVTSLFSDDGKTVETPF